MTESARSSTDVDLDDVAAATVTTHSTAASEYVVLRRCDVEALIEEHAIDEDPFWRPVLVATVSLPSCSCGSIRLYAEDPPRLGPHHQRSCSRWEQRR